MRAWFRKWGGLCVFFVTIFAVIGYLSWRSWQPVTLDPSQLTASSNEVQTITGLELTLDFAGLPYTAILSNHTEVALESGASVGTAPDDLFFHLGLEVLIDDVWYIVPHKDFASAGVGLRLAPGEAVNGRTDFSVYGRLPDGQYRASYYAFSGEYPHQVHYITYAYFSIEDGRYISL